jgi:hypothetical protein
MKNKPLSIKEIVNSVFEELPRNEKEKMCQIAKKINTDRSFISVMIACEQMKQEGSLTNECN